MPGSTLLFLLTFGANEGPRSWNNIDSTPFSRRNNKRCFPSPCPRFHLKSLFQGLGIQPLLLRLQHALALRVGEDRLHRAGHRQVRQARPDEGQAAADQSLQPLPVRWGEGRGRDPLQVRPLLHLALSERSFLQVGN